jgi:hypothetical protein
LQHYTPLIKPEYKTRVMEIVSMLLNWYRRMKDTSHLERIDYIMS